MVLGRKILQSNPQSLGEISWNKVFLRSLLSRLSEPDTSVWFVCLYPFIAENQALAIMCFHVYIGYHLAKH